MKPVHTADWHLGPARNRIDPDTGLNARLMDFARCARFVVEDGIERGAELILHGGDVFDSPRPSPTERRLALDALQPAIQAGIPMVIITGNHDMPRSPSERHALDTLRGIRGLTIIDRPCILEAWRFPPPERPTLLIIGSGESAGKCEALELQIACLPWPNVSLLLADEAARKLHPGDRNLLIRERMMDVARGLAAQLTSGVPSVLLAHASLDVAAAGTRDRLMLLGGDWTLNAAELAGLGFSYVALGHIHKPQQIAGNVWYSGSPEACSHGEEGEHKRYLLVDIPPDDPEGITIEQIPTPYRRFITISPNEADGLSLDWSRENMPGAIVRLRLPEVRVAEAQRIRTMIEEDGALEVTIEIERAESVRRAGALEVSAGMEVEAALRTWLAQRPDLEPLADDLVAEGLAIARTAEGGAE
jgi:exonuclease SbcD